MRPIYALALALPVSVLSAADSGDPAIGLAGAVLATAAFAALASDGLSATAAVLGDRRGTVLSAILGDLPELLVASIALVFGMPLLAKAAITGSILASLLGVLGACFVAGGLRHGRQYFNREHASTTSTLMVISAIALVVPAMWGSLVPERNTGAAETLSELVAAAMLLAYALHVFHAATARQAAKPHPLPAAGRRGVTRWKGPVSWLAGIAGVAISGTLLVEACARLVSGRPVTQHFLGAVLVPLAVTVPTLLPAVRWAWRDRLDISMNAVMGSSIRTALFLAPMLVIVSLAIGAPMDLIFTRMEITAIAAAGAVATLVAHDGSSDWLEGAMLIVVFAILGLAFWYWPEIGIVP